MTLLRGPALLRRSVTLRLWGVQVWALAATWAAICVLQAVAVSAVGVVLRTAMRAPQVQDLVTGLPFNDVHAQIALELLGAAYDQRIGLSLPGGELLAQAFPDAIVDHATIGRPGWIGVAFSDWSSPVAVFTARLLATLLLISFGLALAMVLPRLPWTGRRSLGMQRFLAAAPLLVQAYGIAAVFSMAWQGDTGGGAILLMLATKLLDLDSQRVLLSLYGLGPVLSWLIDGLVVMVVYATALSIRAAARVLARRALHLPPPSAAPGMGRALAAFTAVSLVLMTTPLRARSGIEGDAQVVAAEALMPAAELMDHPGSLPPSKSQVVIAPTATGYEYRVNGERLVVRGIGYNVGHRRLPFDTRQRVLDRDFSLMHAAGFNTLLGWDSEEFDHTLMDAAARNGLGVVAPLVFPAEDVYRNPNLYAAAKARVRAWVLQLRNEPALRMWGLGNESFQVIRDDDEYLRMSFARFLVEMADYIHTLDPDHPVVYREAEDAWVGYLHAALSQGGPRPWFVYGMNIFRPRITEALADGPATYLGQPLLVSEFAPAGIRGRRQHDAYLQMWRAIRAFPDRVLGGFAYAWSQTGEEPLDTLFGITNVEGRPSSWVLRAFSEEFAREDNGD